MTCIRCGAPVDPENGDYRNDVLISETQRCVDLQREIERLRDAIKNALPALDIMHYKWHEYNGDVTIDEAGASAIIEAEKELRTAINAKE